jgi:type I restriction enzyme S subunit
MNDFVPPGWKREPLENLAQVVSGGTPSRHVAAFWEGGTIPWVTPTDIANTSGRYLSETRETITELGLQSCSATLLPEGSLLMTSRATLGEVRISTRNLCTNQGFKSLIPFKSVNNEFLYYQVALNKERYKLFGTGTTFLEVNKRDTERFELLVAPENQQRRIAEILSKVDDAMGHTEALIAKYQQVKAGLMHDLFTRGVTPDGQLRPTRTKSPQLYKKDPILGWVPKEWEVDRIGALFTRRMERGVAGLPVMSIIMSGGMVRRDSVDRRVESNLTAEAHLLVRRGDIAYNMMRMWQGVLGRAEYDGLVSPAYIVMTPTPRIDSVFAEYLLSTKTSIAWFKRRSYGVVDDRLRLYAHDLVHIPLALPSSLNEQRAIVERLQALDTSIRETRVSLAKLRSQKQGLMQDLLTGRVPVRPAESGSRQP